MPSHPHARAFLLAIVALACFVPHARATTLIDQEYVLTNGGFEAFSSAAASWRRAQTFTVGITGTLSEIDVFYGGTGTFSGVNILATVAGVPAGLAGTGTVLSQNSGMAAFSVNLPVTIGEVLAIEPIVSSGFPSWVANTHGIYAGGSDYFLNAAIGFPNFTATCAPPTPECVQNNFRTFVDLPIATPLPTALPLFAAGLGMLGLLARRRRKVTNISG